MRTRAHHLAAAAGQWEHLDALAAWPDPARTFPYQHCFERAARRHELPVALLLAVARGESDFDPSATSGADALGLMQIRWPQTARHLGIASKSKLFEPCTNVDAGARYLKEMLARYDGSTHRALAAYNHGPGRIPTGDAPLPAKARWYSAYIRGHFDYVTAHAETPDRTPPYAAEGRLPVIRFSRPYRASALVQSLKSRRPALRLDVFRRPNGRYEVVLLYADPKERSASLRILKGLGIEPV